MSNSWSRYTNPETVAKRAGGRRRYNSWRQFAATFRRAQVSRLLRFKMTQVEIARKLNVHPSTVCRDIKQMAQEQWITRCPHCGKPVGKAVILDGEYRRVLDVLDAELGVGNGHRPREEI